MRREPDESMPFAKVAAETAAQGGDGDDLESVRQNLNHETIELRNMILRDRFDLNIARRCQISTMTEILQAIRCTVMEAKAAVLESAAAGSSVA